MCDDGMMKADVTVTEEEFDSRCMSPKKLFGRKNKARVFSHARKRIVSHL